MPGARQKPWAKLLPLSHRYPEHGAAGDEFVRIPMNTHFQEKVNHSPCMPSAVFQHFDFLNLWPHLSNVTIKSNNDELPSREKTRKKTSEEGEEGEREEENACNNPLQHPLHWNFWRLDTAEEVLGEKFHLRVQVLQQLEGRELGTESFLGF